ncbi:MAG: DUF2851 family protein [Candidatus Pedobacter colombiensis]|uniref:DUF2851 family protein n=1 Tax=Candidatus Pedobacter colombiensis TaxID=3121371 RepID=A0AAJ5W705_9SPHI|nr:DUF2851 family protein [Pedobacter sp.]WEK18164.1 MAG: DUF2851 family protein [Pedobacter sp.]
MDFSEHFLHFIWQFRLLNSAKLYCEDGEELQVLHPGILNKHAGPDFSGAKLVIDGLNWVGDVEIHLKSSDWLAHGHQHNPAYNSVVLHVVYQYDSPIYRTNGSLVPVLVLKNLFSDHLFANYSELIATVNPFPCQKHIADVDRIVVDAFLSRVMIERFEQKSEEVFKKLSQNRGDWEQTFYYFLARNFGFKVNAVPFELLADALPHHLFSKYKDNALQIAALIFGQAGFLEQPFIEVYPRQLQKEYAFLRKKHSLTHIESALWKFLRMRPQNFPTIRLAQFAALILKSNHLFSKILKAGSVAEMQVLFSELPVNEYWRTHYHFNKNTGKVIVQPGLQFVHNIIINTVCLFLFSYGKYTDQPELVDRAIDFLERIPSESNAIVNQYVSAGVIADRAFTSQALLQLNKFYCSQKKCLNCAIGIKILKK